ncbi:ATP-binding protein [Bordetella petrii]|uniref:ATP-binding protein n=1 Tax=Bordetella petrii TaxID=94624 RepID=UPI001A978925|nr:ATP-binding protein [Bordetella petrii]MBO1114232.1 response regulator [Bordetella petrii]
MSATHPEAAWVAALLLFAPIAMGTVAFLFLDRHHLRHERDTLQSREQYTRRAIESITDTGRVALFLMRQDTRGQRSFFHVMGRTERFIGCPAEHIIADADNWLRRLPDADRATLEQSIARSLAESRPIRADLQVRRSSGTGWVRLGTGMPDRRPDRSVIWAGYWADTTPEHEQARILAQAKHDAEASAEAKARFLAAMSHEIRTPLATIIGALDLMRETGLQAEQRQHYQLADDAARLLMEIIGDILDFSRLESGYTEPEAVPFDLRDVLGQVLRVFELQARRKGIALTLDVAPGVAQTLTGDPTRIQQIVLNLVGNAVKFTEQGGIHVSARLEAAPRTGTQDDGQHGGQDGALDVAPRTDAQASASPDVPHIALTVADTGIGIPESVHNQLFQSFTQADVSTARRYGGSGLGLAICHRLAGLLGGSISLLHSAPGQGSAFQVRLPLPVARGTATADAITGTIDGDARINADTGTGASAKADIDIDSDIDSGRAARPAARTAARRAAPGAQTVRVLAVDDHEPYRIILGQLMLRAGLNCDTAADAEQALEALHQHDYAMLFTDCQMPGIDGCELARRVRQQEAQALRPRLPIVGVTADCSTQQMQRCRASGMDDYLAKPVAFTDLQKCINKWIN